MALGWPGYNEALVMRWELLLYNLFMSLNPTA